MPEGQLLHWDEPGNTEYMPARHKRHAEELLAPPCEEYLPAGQLLQTDEPEASEKVPARQSQDVPGEPSDAVDSNKRGTQVPT